MEHRQSVTQLPDTDGQVKDAERGNWVDRFAPRWSRPYLRLSRADRPSAATLLLWPCWWAVLLAANATGRFGWTEIWVMAGCFLGAFLMRGAGCTWNDITDRKFDAQVDRTASRPLPSGQVSVRGAVVWMGVQALVSFAILLTFHPLAIVLGIASLGLVAIYPFAKRFTWWPQVFLGLAFNWGAVLGWAAVTGTLGWPALALYGAGIAWTLFYDTIYAHQDTEDDALIGVKSTARLFGETTHRWLRRFMMLTVTLMTLAILLAILPDANVLTLAFALGAPWAMGWHLTWQIRRLDIDDPENCMHLFRSNREAGLIPLGFLGLALAAGLL